jgi:hypothetical protein
VTVHRSESDQGTECADCGAPILSGAEAGFGFGEDAMLCSTCATRRGGCYDAHQERWTESPRVADLLEEPDR